MRSFQRYFPIVKTVDGVLEDSLESSVTFTREGELLGKVDNTAAKRWQKREAVLEAVLEENRGLWAL
ncbi:Hypothetical predicted protein [Octopus vulgaris]|uniref:Uncharacterized protein n=1 Tax=Octopus vulgaris TaxID=6645 RepID=A0AA36B1K0_OCTVU|nr:Hypothetical predicted protein [Octopus vulgaris]